MRKQVEYGPKIWRYKISNILKNHAERGKEDAQRDKWKERKKKRKPKCIYTPESRPLPKFLTYRFLILFLSDEKVWRRTENRMKVTKLPKICLQKMSAANFSCSALLVLIGRYPVWLLFFSACSKRSEASLSFLSPSGNKSTVKSLENAPYYIHYDIKVMNNKK